MAGRKSVLLIKGDQRFLYTYASVLGDNYDVTSRLYKDSNHIPRGRFDNVVVDDMDGDWKTVADKTNAGTIFVLSDNQSTVEEANGREGCEGVNTLFLKWSIDGLATMMRWSDEEHGRN